MIERIKIGLLLLLAITTPLVPYNQAPSPDVVIELNKVSEKLKKMWQQKIKDSRVYDKMLNYQKGLSEVYETSEFLNQTKSILDLIRMIELYACRIRGLHEYINNDSFLIPDGCGFSYKYQKALAAFNMSLDFVSIIMDVTQMSIEDRLDKLKKAKEKLEESEMAIAQMRMMILYYNS